MRKASFLGRLIATISMGLVLGSDRVPYTSCTIRGTLGGRDGFNFDTYRAHLRAKKNGVKG
jgi:hypothetical protein